MFLQWDSSSAITIISLLVYKYIIIGLQGFCVFHSMKRGTQAKWIWLIVFLPVIGSVAYIYTEMISKRNIGHVPVNIGKMFNPGGSIKQLEKRMEFSDTFDNRVALANGLMRKGETDRAITLFESCLTGVFIDNEYVLFSLVIAYYEKERFSDVLRTAEKVKNNADFRKSPAHLRYTLALAKSGRPQEAESEFKTMQGRFSDFEARYEYGEFLIRADRYSEAQSIFQEVEKEAAHMSWGEKGNDRYWISKCKAALSELEKATR